MNLNFGRVEKLLKFIHMIEWIAMWLGIGDSLVHLIIDMRSSAIYAQYHNQISFERFSKMLTSLDYALKQVTGLEELKKSNTNFVSLTERVDTESPIGKAVFVIITGGYKKQIN